MKLVVLMPCRDDSATAFELWDELRQVLEAGDFEPELLLLDDASREGIRVTADVEGRVEVLTMRLNLGHQRAIACGLCHLADRESPPPLVLILDSDGEDKPQDAVRLAQSARASGATAVVFAERIRRSENWIFVCGYHLYLLIHHMLVGRAQRIGNFSAVPGHYLDALTLDSNLWSHYAASVWKSGIPIEFVPCSRGMRRRGRSRMNLTALVSHGIAAISCYRETIAVRMAIFGVGCVVGSLTLMIAVGLAHAANPSPMTFTVVIALSFLLLISLWGGLLSLFFLLQIHQGRNLGTVIPRRDYTWFVRSNANQAPL
jgi:hypothetical protein